MPQLLFALGVGVSSGPVTLEQAEMAKEARARTRRERRRDMRTSM
jgi:hypothetical protein